MIRYVYLNMLFADVHELIWLWNEGLSGTESVPLSQTPNPPLVSLEGNNQSADV